MTTKFADLLLLAFAYSAATSMFLLLSLVCNGVAVPETGSGSSIFRFLTPLVASLVGLFLVDFGVEALEPAMYQYCIPTCRSRRSSRQCFGFGCGPLPC